MNIYPLNLHENPAGRQWLTLGESVKDYLFLKYAKYLILILSKTFCSYLFYK